MRFVLPLLMSSLAAQATSVQEDCDMAYWPQWNSNNNFAPGSTVHELASTANSAVGPAALEAKAQTR